MDSAPSTPSATLTAGFGWSTMRRLRSHETDVVHGITFCWFHPTLLRPSGVVAGRVPTRVMQLERYCKPNVAAPPDSSYIPRFVAVEDIVLHLPFAVHLLPRHHELSHVLDAPTFGTIHAVLVGAGLVRDVARTRDEDLGGLEGEPQARGLGEHGPRRPDGGAAAAEWRSLREEFCVLREDVADRDRIPRGHCLDPLLVEITDDLFLGGSVHLGRARADGGDQRDREQGGCRRHNALRCRGQQQ